MTRMSVRRYTAWATAAGLGLLAGACGVKGPLEPPAGSADTGPRDVIIVPPSADEAAPDAGESVGDDR